MKFLITALVAVLLLAACTPAQHTVPGGGGNQTTPKRS